MNTAVERRAFQRGVFNWDERTQGIVLGAFFYGFASTQVVSGLVAQRIGGKLLVLLGLFTMALLTLLTPLLATVGDFGALFVVRLVEGVGGVRVESQLWYLAHGAPHVKFFDECLQPM